VAAVTLTLRPGSPASADLVPAGLNGHGQAAAELFAEDLARGEVPGVRRIRRELKVGQPKAQQVRSYLELLAAGSGHGGQPCQGFPRRSTIMASC
jgi:hypothetical protein